jgi:hypothetical protein
MGGNPLAQIATKIRSDILRLQGVQNRPVLTSRRNATPWRTYGSPAAARTVGDAGSAPAGGVPCPQRNRGEEGGGRRRGRRLRGFSAAAAAAAGTGT